MQITIASPSTIASPQKVRKLGNSLVVTIPADFAEQHNIKPEDLARITPEPVELVSIPRLAPELQKAVDQVLDDDLPALRYLRGHALAGGHRLSARIPSGRRSGGIGTTPRSG